MSRAFQIDSGATVTISGLTIRNAQGGESGGILNGAFIAMPIASICEHTWQSKRQSLLLNKPAAVHYPFMDDVALVIDEREAARADFIRSDDITAALVRAQ